MRDQRRAQLHHGEVSGAHRHAALDAQRVFVANERPQALAPRGQPQRVAGRQRAEQCLVGRLAQSAASTYLMPAGVMRGPFAVRFTLPGCVRNALATLGAAYFTPCFAQNFEVVPLDTSMASPAT